MARCVGLLHLWTNNGEPVQRSISIVLRNGIDWIGLAIFVNRSYSLLRKHHKNTYSPVRLKPASKIASIHPFVVEASFLRKKIKISTIQVNKWHSLTIAWAQLNQTEIIRSVSTVSSTRKSKSIGYLTDRNMPVGLSGRARLVNW